MQIKEDYYWTVQYNDGSEISQFTNEGTERKFSDIKQKSPFLFSLKPFDKTKTTYCVVIEGNKRLIYFRRRIGQLKMGSSQSAKILQTIYVFGWQITIDEKNIKSLTWINPQNNTSYNTDELNVKVQ